MSDAVKTALVNEALEISNMFDQNCALKHGLPDKPSKKQVSELPDDPAPQPPPINITNNIPAAPTAPTSSSPGVGAADGVKRSLIAKAAPYLLTAAVSGGIPTAAYWLLNGGQEPAAPTRTEGDSLLLEWLQENGEHLPGGWRNG